MKNLILLFLLLSGLPVFSQEAKDQATVETSIGNDGAGKIIVEARGTLPELKVFYSSEVQSKVTISQTKVVYEVDAKVRILQGDARTISYHTQGLAEVTAVTGKSVAEWAVRWDEKKRRFIDIRLKESEKPLVDHTFQIQMQQEIASLPAAPLITNLSPAPDHSTGFHEVLTLHYANGVEGRVKEAANFYPVQSDESSPNQFQTAKGGRFVVQLNRSGSSPAPVELRRFDLSGELSGDGKSISFQLRGTARVSKPGAELRILSGTAAVVEPIVGRDFSLQLRQAKNGPYYVLQFTRPGDWPVDLRFVSPVTPDKGWSRIHFDLATGAVAPFALTGVGEAVEIRPDSSLLPKVNEDGLSGFLPANGSCHLAWREKRTVGQGKLFFSTSAQVETTVGAGLLQQSHQIDYKILQGKLDRLALTMEGPGEVLDVVGTNVVGWEVSGDSPRKLEVKLSQTITKTAQLTIQTRLALDAFPVRTAGIQLTPVGTVRHSGHIRLSNRGSVRLEPVSLEGLTQLSPDQFPGGKLEARQVFVYRFPSADRRFEVSADRIQPEVNISQRVLYQLAESDRIISADLELDIREAPIREWNLLVPSDYSVVSVTGAGVSDSVSATEEENGMRNVKVIFGSDLSGRQLLSIQLEKNETAEAGGWILPRLEFPGAESVRGDIGIVGAPGFRINVGANELLTEKPLSYFPKPVPNLQQAFRIREPGWSATMQIELLEKSVQADVFHLYSLSEGTAFGSVLINYFVTGAPVSELKIVVPEGMGNVAAEGKDIRTFRHVDEILSVSLHQPLIGPYTLLITFEEELPAAGGTLAAGRVTPLEVQGERGFLQVVSSMQVQTGVSSISEDLLALDALELPAEFRLLSSAPSLGSWQYTERPFELAIDVNWFEPGTTMTQVVEFSEINSRVSPDGELVTDVIYYVKSRGRRALKLHLPDAVRLWAVTVNGNTVSARQSGEATLIPLPGGTDPNIPVEVELRLGRPAMEGSDPLLALPLVDAPVLKTEWKIEGDEQHLLVPTGGNVSPPASVLPETGFSFLSGRGLGEFATLAAVLLIGLWFTRFSKLTKLQLPGMAILVLCLLGAGMATMRAGSFGHGSPPLLISLPLLTTGEEVVLSVKNTPLWQLSYSWSGLLLALAGIGLLLKATLTRAVPIGKFTWLVVGGVLTAVGLLLQHDHGQAFYAILSLAILVLLLLTGKAISRRRRERKADTLSGDQPAAEVSLLIGTLAALFAFSPAPAKAQVPEGYQSLQTITQEWKIDSESGQILGNGTVSLSGESGDSFLLLRAPAVLTKFEGAGLRVSRQELSGLGLCYVLTIEEKSAQEASTDDPFAELVPEAPSPDIYKASFSFQSKVGDLTKGIPLPTGPAAIHSLKATYDKPGWEFQTTAAVKIIPAPESNKESGATLLLSPLPTTTIQLKPKARDVASEQTSFFVETANLYLPSPGVVDGKHRIHIRPAQGQVKELQIEVPKNLTVGGVTGPIAAWQFDAAKRTLAVTLEPVQSATFDLHVDTQLSLAPLPADLVIQPLRVGGNAGEVGLVALAFGSDAQPEKVDSDTMSAVNPGDFDAKLLPNESTTLHRVYRYGKEGGEVTVRVAPVAPEVRLTTKQILSLGEERIVLGVNFAAEISRTGLFQLSFPLPPGYEVESLSGDSLHHWAELSEGEARSIVLHLNGKTIGTHTFSLTLSSSTPSDLDEWSIPRFELKEANRQTGELIIKPTTGLRLRTVSRQNASEVDPRSVGGDGKGALAFRLLQQDWDLVLGVEKLDPWITGNVLHEVTLREGQSRTTLFSRLKVENASVQSLLVRLPISDPDVIKTLIASGTAVSDLIRKAADSDVWEVRFKRRVVGEVDIRIEFERRGDRVDDVELLNPASFPDSRQLGYHFAVRSGGRIEIEAGELSRGWQTIDWNSVPQVLRESGDRNAPILTLRAVSPEEPLSLAAVRHSLAEALKLRVAQGQLTTVLSPLGEELTAVDLTMQVVQRSSLTVGLPAASELFSVFVNGESVHSVRDGATWQFYILPGTDDHTASVRFVYSTTGQSIKKIELASPQLNVPLENITWNVIAPQGFRLIDQKGDLELKQREYKQQFNRASYLSIAEGKKKEQANQAAELLQEANDLLQAGEQDKAAWAFNNVANRVSLDAASNEDARVQLENLQTQQAVVGLNTRRQRILLDNSREQIGHGNVAQMEAGIAGNPILQNGELKFRPQELSQLLQGNTTEDNAALQRMAARLVQHQRATIPAPRAISITLPEEGTAYTFHRTVQVSENAPLQLGLSFGRIQEASAGRGFLLLLLLALLAGAFAKCRKVTS
ncbi:MAG: hypothetical protein P1U87_05930 [Verrucomicrobiales bacterium]|nr:hypothetical protein [Verrucomicrobiales bacterium]